MALDKANITFRGVHAIASTAGPGLLGGLLVGVVAGKTLASSLKNHLSLSIT